MTNDKGALQGPSASTILNSDPSTGKPTASQLLDTPGALLTRGHLAELGLGRRAVDSIFRAVPAVVMLPGYSRPMIRAADYLALVADSIHRGDRVR